MIFPDRVTHKRPGRTANVDGLEVAGAPTTLTTSLRAMIVQPGSGVTRTDFGQSELASDAILLKPLDADGKLLDVRAGDLFVNEAESLTELWLATGPGTPMRLPGYFPTTGAKYSHIEVSVIRSDVESDGARDEDYYPQ